jgi:Ni/Co efflux regulator RcnB
MRKLSLSILAASIALLPAAAIAQGARPGPGHGPRPPAGHSWRGGGMVGMPAHGPNVQVRHYGGGQMRHGGGNFRYQRMNRGFVINPFWFGSQFHINNWQMYGFSNPGADQRWVRYYDDAYLIDRGGRVVDTRYGMDWDRYGEDWDMDDGVPAYRGRGDHARGDDDGDWEERHDDRGGGHGEGHGDRDGHDEHHMMMQGGPGHGAAYGGYYGYGAYAYPIVIETITTTGGGYTEEIVEEYVQVRHRARRARPRCVCAAPRPVVRRVAPRPVRARPPAGERG